MLKILQNQDACFVSCVQTSAWYRSGLNLYTRELISQYKQLCKQSMLAGMWPLQTVKKKPFLKFALRHKPASSRQYILESDVTLAWKTYFAGQLQIIPVDLKTFFFPLDFPYIPLLYKSTLSVWSKTTIEHIDFLIRISEKERKISKSLWLHLKGLTNCLSTLTSFFFTMDSLFSDEWRWWNECIQKRILKL